MRLAIIGAGWAGAAAAYAATEHGIETVVFEAAPVVGGRARKHHSKPLGLTIDNGQHLLIGAYEHTLGLMQNLGLDLDQAFYRFPLTLQTASGSLQLRARPYSAPWHVVSALLAAKGLSWPERWAMIRLQLYLQRNQWQTPRGWHVSTILNHTKQPHTLIEKIWQPLCVGALNTPITDACAQLFSHVIRDSLGGLATHADMLIPRINMSDLWATSALANAKLQLGHTVRQLLLAQSHQIVVEGQYFDHVIIATNAPSALRLLQSLSATTEEAEFLRPLRQLSYNPIATLYLQPDTAWAAPYALLMLEDQPNGLAAGQWAFNHAAIPKSELKNTIAITISYANRLLNQDRSAITHAIIDQINTQSRWPLPSILNSELIIEKRATFAATPLLTRPTHITPWPRIHLAGDWVKSPYPAVLESAVKSGLQAVEHIKNIS